ncbi:MAG: PorP/SprF family type IX secretion system membrane protein [Deltaproteobacteria bacterium]
MRDKIILLLIFFSCGLNYLNSQDFHYSQFYNEPLNFNPSLTGIYEGDQRFILSMRDQYRSIAVPYFTFSGSYDRKFLPNIPRKGFFSAGAVFNYDKQGYSKLTLFNLNLTGSYSYLISSRNIITAGALLGYSNKGFNIDDLKWYNNWDKDLGVYDPRIPSGEDFESFRIGYLETGLGLNFRHQFSPRNNITIGASAFHLNRPSHSFYGVNSDKLDIRLTYLGILNLKLIDPLDIQLDILHQEQDVYKETMIGGLLKLYLSNTITKRFAVHGGAMIRLDEGYSPKIAFEYNQWYFGLSYDIVTKDGLSDYSNYRGGPEMHLRYIITNAKPLGAFKICPIY